MEQLSVDMGGPRYSISDLHRLRTTLPVVACVISRINKHPDIASIFRLPDEAFKNPDRFSCETKTLAGISNKLTIQHNLRRQLGNSSEESEYQKKSESSAVRDLHQVQWNLRRREDSDRSSQPYSAPSGLVAQQSENFQRFYRAVASPTHVRVTAGGRIVPNTRVATTPAFEWNAERQHFEPVQPLQDELSNNQSSFWPQNTSNPTSPPFPPNEFIPPYQFMPQGNNLVLPVMAHQASSNISPMEKTAFEDENGSGRVSQPIKISPPGQFDQTKPFMYNGQLVYPISQRFQPPVSALPVPVAMLGNSTFMQGPAPLPAGFFPPQLPVQITNMPNHFMFPPGQQFPMGLQPVGHISQQLGQAPHFVGLAGMLSASELTKNQLQDLRHLLKAIDHQLLNNKHQINTTQMLNQRSVVESQIVTMEAILKAQLKQEFNGHVGACSETLGDYSEHNTGRATGKRESLTTDRRASSPRAPKPITSSPAQIIETSTDENNQCVPQNSELATRAASNSISRLSAAAAMAPPFQPRSQGIVHQPTGLATVKASKQVPDLNGARTDQKRQAGNVSFSRAQSLHEPLQKDLNDNQILGFHRSNTFHGQSGAAGVMAVVDVSLHPRAVPYLVGILPTGLKPSEALAQDLTYSRELTDEEVRARYLYWGKAPRHVQSGLPKFDGKDFYPPSPVKEIASLATPKAPNRQPARPVLPDFTNLFVEPGAPVNKSPSTDRSVSSIPQMCEMAAHRIVDSTAGYRPIERQFLTPGSTSSGLGNWQAQTISGDRITYQSLTPNRKRASEGDFSSLFLERGVPGYRSPSPPPPPRQITRFSHEEPTTSSWNAPAEIVSPVKNDEASETSTVEIHLTPHINQSFKGKASGVETPFAERVANFNSEQQTLFLQNMLKNTATMSSPAQLGGITSTTAQGYLPHYRGSAAASLSPAVLNIAGLSRDTDHSVSKHDSPRVANGSLVSVNVLSENRPLSRAIPIIRPPPESMDAEGYMRYLNQKAEDDKQAQLHGWNTNTTGTGPVMGSNW